MSDGFDEAAGEGDGAVGQDGAGDGVDDAGVFEDVCSLGAGLPGGEKLVGGGRHCGVGTNGRW